jgi:glutamate N-acetyltransferase/amino-acid N-acetyltransferase
MNHALADPARNTSIVMGGLPEQLVMMPTPDIFSVPGTRLGTVCAGIKKADRRDLIVMDLAPGTNTAAVFTQNAFCAAPVVIARQHLSTAMPRFLLINTGYANAGTGSQGISDAQQCCEALADLAGAKAEEILPFSTGVIGESLPVSKLTQALPDVLTQLSPEGWGDAAWGIMTTDTRPKLASRRIVLQETTITLTGMAKGAGMIRPDMATMLAFIATDASIKPDVLQALLYEAVEQSFNRISVDGDTSTNDACVLCATGQTGDDINAESSAYHEFKIALTDLCEELAKSIVRDGEGATKLISIQVNGGRNQTECLAVAYTVAHSPLVKTAFFAADPNWGRILAAVGRAGMTDLDITSITIFLDEVCIVRNGERDQEYTESQGQAVMDRDEITVKIELGRGNDKAKIWTCDFSYDYVRINAEYRT